MDPTENKAMTTLVVKHLPDAIVESEASAHQFFSSFDATRVRLMQSRSMRGMAFVDFASADAAKKALAALARHYPHVDYATPHDNRESRPEKSIDAPRLEKGAAAAIAPTLGLQYPANPHLRYRYPDPTPETLTNMMHAIATVPRLYVQVLHLMNKMNLRPPFRVDHHAVPDLVKKRKRDDLVASDESELESDEDEREIHRAKIPDNQPTISPTEEPPAEPVAAGDLPVQEGALTLKEIRSKCMNSIALKALPACKNYKRGDTSRRLYIKNLAKQVQDDELHRIFAMFHPSMIDLKKTGRLRGQAFVTFDDTSMAVAALEAAHGYVLYDKPMVIQFSHFIG